MNPLDYYHHELSRHNMSSDLEQLDVMNQLQLLYTHLIDEEGKRHRVLSRFRKPVAVRGVYLWGGVGIGKTFMMD